MKTIDIQEAGAHFARLITRVEMGEEFTIARAGLPVARLIPVAFARGAVRIGGLEARTDVPDDFNTMFDDEVRALFGITAV